MTKHKNLLITLGFVGNLLFFFFNCYFISKKYSELSKELIKIKKYQKKIIVELMKDSKNWYSEENKQLYFENLKYKTEEEIEEKLYLDFLKTKTEDIDIEN